MIKFLLAGLASVFILSACQHGSKSSAAEEPHSWRNATIYFLMTDRFFDGDPDRNSAYGRQPDGDKLRSFLGGDLQGVIDKLEAGYFDDLSVTAIWTTPVLEQVHMPFQEFGRSYAFHGYWIQDWTSVDAAFGDEETFARFVELAHERNIRVVVDVVINHAGPEIDGDHPKWPADWVRSAPACDWQSFAGNATCVIVPALQDILTESEVPVSLPPQLVAKWKAEGRYEQEMAELDAFFERTGYPRAPKYYIVKWLTDWVREYGVDAFRADTAKHVEPEVWVLVKKEAAIALKEWQAKNPEKAFHDDDFYMFGEVYNYGIAGFDRAVPGTRLFDFGDIQVDFFDYGFDGLINMGFPTHARMDMPELFELYSSELNGVFDGVDFISYMSSHDDQSPLDAEREDAWTNAIKFVLVPGAIQIYYGDETNRSLKVEGTTGDATLRSFMNWDELNVEDTQRILEHWQKLLAFRRANRAVGDGVHREISREPFVFSRTRAGDMDGDAILVAVDETNAFSKIPTGETFQDGERLIDNYSGEAVTVEDSQIAFSSPRRIALLSKVR
ncbi:MAG: alpha-amylase family glycosyl hydrolase [Pseudomonadota bacterium]